MRGAAALRHESLSGYRMTAGAAIAPRSTQCHAASCYWTMAPKWSARPDSHRVRAGLQSAASTASASRAWESGETNGICTRTTAFTEPDAALTLWSPSQHLVKSGGSGRTCSTTRWKAGPSGFQPAAARWSALASKSKWRPRMDSRHQPPESESGALLI
jgi:hypothetical protein